MSRWRANRAPDKGRADTRSALLALLPGLLAAAVLASAPVRDARAADIAWDGVSYLQIPVRLGSDTRLVMPEPFDDSWEREGEVAAVLMDPRTMIIRPRSASIEQRLTLRGRRSGTLYLARVSTALPFAPIINVRNAALVHDDSQPSRTQPTVVGLLKAMMQGMAPAGFQVMQSQRVLFDQAPYRIVAQQVWRSRRQTAIFALLSTSLPEHAIPIVPANILIQIPELGTLRAMAADDFELSATRLTTRVYLVYTN